MKLQGHTGSAHGSEHNHGCVWPRGTKACSNSSFCLFLGDSDRSGPRSPIPPMALVVRRIMQHTGTGIDSSWLFPGMAGKAIAALERWKPEAITRNLLVPHVLYVAEEAGTLRSPVKY